MALQPGWAQVVVAAASAPAPGSAAPGAVPGLELMLASLSRPALSSTGKKEPSWLKGQRFQQRLHQTQCPRLRRSRWSGRRSHSVLHRRSRQDGRHRRRRRGPRKGHDAACRCRHRCSTSRTCPRYRYQSHQPCRSARAEYSLGAPRRCSASAMAIVVYESARAKESWQRSSRKP